MAELLFVIIDRHYNDDQTKPASTNEYQIHQA